MQQSFLKIRLQSNNFERFTTMNQKSDQSQPSKHPTVIGRFFDL